MDRDKIDRVKRAIASAEVEKAHGSTRSLSYYAGVGIDYFKHDYERILPALWEAAAIAAIEACKTPKRRRRS